MTEQHRPAYLALVAALRAEFPPTSLEALWIQMREDRDNRSSLGVLALAVHDAHDLTYDVGGRGEALEQITAAWAALNRAGFQSPVAGIAELIDELAAALADAEGRGTALAALLTKSREQAAKVHEQNAAAQNALRSLGQAYADLKTDNDELAAENARVRQDRDTKADIAKNRAGIITNLGAALNAHAAVVEAAKVWRFSGNTAGEHREAIAALNAAVDALAKAEAIR